MNWKKMLATGALATACFVAVPASAALAEGYATPDGATVTDSTPGVGDTVTIEVGGFGPYTTVTIELHSDPVVLGTFTADGEGFVRATVKLPSGVSGSHNIVVLGTNAEGAPVVATIPVEIGGAADDDGGSTITDLLPRTGSSTATIVMLGGVLVAFGTTATVITRKRLATVSSK